MSDYMLDNVVWSLAGLTVGYALGKAEVTLRSLFKRRSSHDDT